MSTSREMADADSAPFSKRVSRTIRTFRVEFEGDEEYKPSAAEATFGPNGVHGFS